MIACQGGTTVSISKGDGRVRWQTQLLFLNRALDPVALLMSVVAARGTGTGSGGKATAHAEAKGCKGKED